MTAQRTGKVFAQPKRFKTADGTAPHLTAAANAAKGVLDLVSGLQEVPYPLLQTLLQVFKQIFAPTHFKPRVKTTSSCCTFEQVDTAPK